MRRPRLLITVAVVALLAAGFLFVTLRPEPAPDALTNREPYCVSGEVSVDELHIPSGAMCEFDPERDSILRVGDGSVLVEGLLKMRPGSGDVTHRLVFGNVDESEFEGAGMGPTSIADPILDSDPGLWVMGNGSLDLQGTRRTGWTRDPDQAVGWQASDELRITPTEVEDFESRPWSMGDPVPQAYPEVPSAEVFNLTRNVVIEGTPEGNAHVFIRSNEPSTIKFASFEHLGPRCECDASENAPEEGPITGRWALTGTTIMGVRAPSSKEPLFSTRPPADTSRTCPTESRSPTPWLTTWTEPPTGGILPRRTRSRTPMGRCGRGRSHPTLEGALCFSGIH
jgi:hypothetical protein